MDAASVSEDCLQREVPPKWFLLGSNLGFRCN